MQHLPQALAPLAAYKQFILYKLVWDEVKQKHNKIPLNPFTRAPYPKKSDWQKDPSQMSDFQTASANCIQGHGIGFLFTPNDPFFFVDIDSCLNADGKTWSKLSLDILSALPGAAVEVSSSGKGLHIFGSGKPLVNYANRNDALHIELYTEWRFVALTGFGANGCASTPLHAQIDDVASRYYPKKVAFDDVAWTDSPVTEWRGPEDDDELIAKMLSVRTASSIFGGKSNIQTLWEGDVDALATLYPDPEKGHDASRADAALAQHLAYWTGNNCERILTLMQLSGLRREKWDGRLENYLEPTIRRAVALQKEFYCEVDLSVTEKYGAGKITASTDAQREFAEKIRAEIVAKASEDDATFLCQKPTNAQFWIDGKDKSAAELAAMLKPLAKVETVKTSAVSTVTGWQYLSATLQMEKFDGCVYISDLHRIWGRDGILLNQERFNAMHGGYVYQIDEQGKSTTKNAWDAFLGSQCVRFPKAHSSVFDPLATPGEIVDREGLLCVNTYVPIETARVQGDASPFLNHLEKLLPLKSDRDILLAYMAAVVQHKGVKFQWAPLIQGAPGNGKTLFSRCLTFAVGQRHSYTPKAKELTSKFNAWLVGRIFVGVEDIYVPEAKREVLEELKPMITNSVIEIEGKGADQYNSSICCNFILNSNHKDAIRKSRDDRRFAVFYTSQQSELDIVRDGMGGEYFPKLYDWLNAEGYAIVNDFLHTYSIPVELNPALKSHRAPITSSTDEAVEFGLGGIEQDILEAISEERVGFAGDWVSSVALDRLLHDLRADRAIPRNKRRGLMQSLGYDYHPMLKDGRVNGPIQIDDNRKPRLYVKHGHLSFNAHNAGEVVAMYLKAQGVGVLPDPKATRVFGP